MCKIAFIFFFIIHLMYNTINTHTQIYLRRTYHDDRTPSAVTSFSDYILKYTIYTLLCFYYWQAWFGVSTFWRFFKLMLYYADELMSIIVCISGGQLEYENLTAWYVLEGECIRFRLYDCWLSVCMCGLGCIEFFLACKKVPVV